MEQKALQVGAVVVLLAVLLRVAGTRPNLKEEAAQTLLLFSTGRLPAQTQPVEDTEGETEITVPTDAAPVFGYGELDLVQVAANQELDMLGLLGAPLNWNLRAEEPAVLILHTHGSESYENTENYVASSDYRTLDTACNMVSIGQAVTERLEAEGIRVIHDRTLHDYPDYNGAYGNARESIQRILQENPSVCMVLDLHRDAAQDDAGNQVRHTVQTDRGEAAQLMLVMGSDSGVLTHEQWQKNLSLAVKLQAQLEGNCPGLCRPIQLRSSRYNQDLSTGALLIEVGSAGNTRQEALLAADFLADGIIALAGGANRE